ncbi:ABC transporter permease [Paenibacillus flagellatus]|uniref:Sugar ABC transporter permease n=1 Tax=Paenibacillus flagellatus TaxID=2211139 RepID=A0A2V5K3W4_9BACL|nr:ABC transporter permease subunit [Paenibacillus flagellatus]PYI53342.1 sugar ABC transporter permease [Paenibacillus flagellatus]
MDSAARSGKTTTAATSTSRPGFARSFVQELVRNKYLYLLTLPAVVFFFVFSYLPMFGVVIAFQDYNPIKGIFGSEFVGLRNFDFFFTSSDWLKVTFNTLYLNTLFIGFGLLAQIAFAIMISEIVWKPFQKATQSLTLLPYFISWPIVAMFAVSLFSTDSGFINRMLAAAGMDPIHFYQNPDIWPATLTLLKIWKGTGYGVIIYLATITSIDRDIYEAAKIDGASRLQAIRYITLPMLANTTILLLLLAVGHMFYGDFGMIYAIIGDNSMLYPTTDVIDTFVFRALRKYSDMSMSSAVGLYQSVVGFVLVLITNAIVRKVNKDAALF